MPPGHHAWVDGLCGSPSCCMPVSRPLTGALPAETCISGELLGREARRRQRATLPAENRRPARRLTKLPESPSGLWMGSPSSRGVLDSRT
jgi:hypothetical protein